MNYITATITLVGGPCNGRPVGVSNDQREVHISVGNVPWYHVYEIDHERMVGVYAGQRDIKLMRVG